jgi:hypothetical protein
MYKTAVRRRRAGLEPAAAGQRPGGLGATAFWVAGHDPRAASLQAAGAARPERAVDAAEAERRKVPDFARTIDHEQK